MARMSLLWSFYWFSAFINLSSAIECGPIDYNADTIERDVAIVGGGSSGTYTAIRLQQLGYSVALIEKEGRLGGQTNTYVDPATNRTFDYGVIILVNTTEVRNYFDHLNVPLATFTGNVVPNEKTLYADYARSMAIRNYTTNYAALGGAYSRYVAQLQKYPYLSSGYHLPDPVPEELLMPYGDFLAKYDLGALAPDIFYINSGVGNILAQPTLYMLKYFNLMQVTAGINHQLVTEANRDLQALYDSALLRLGENRQAFLDSHITSICRSPSGVTIQLQCSSGTKVIKARKLVMAIPPKLEILRPILDLSPSEIQAFQQFNNSYMWNAVISNTGFPSDTAIRNLNPQARFDIPAMPAMYGFAPGFSGLHSVWYGSADYMSEDEAKIGMLNGARQVQRAFGYRSPNGTQPTLLRFHNHSPYGLTVCVDAIRNGFYRQVNRLQGERDTWWTGAAWETQSSSAIWGFTEREILPALVKSLGERTGNNSTWSNGTAIPRAARKRYAHQAHGHKRGHHG